MDKAFAGLSAAVADHFETHPTGVVQLRGSTAVGKTGVSIELAQEFGCEIISADSRQVYRGMDIGTGKVTDDEMQDIPHHLIDIVDPDESYTAGQWKQDTLRLIEEVHARGNRVIIIGGTGLYHDTLYKNYAMPDVLPNPERRAAMMEHEATDPGYLYRLLQQQDLEESYRHHQNSLRYIVRALEIIHFTGKKKSEQSHELPVDYPTLLRGVRRDKEETNMRINARVKQMITEGVGLEAEVRSLVALGYGRSCNAMNGIGYTEMLDFIEGKHSLDKAIELIKRHSHRYAKRQRTRRRRYLTDAKLNPKPNVTYGITNFSE